MECPTCHTAPCSCGDVDQEVSKKSKRKETVKEKHNTEPISFTVADGYITFLLSEEQHAYNISDTTIGSLPSSLCFFNGKVKLAKDMKLEVALKLFPQCTLQVISSQSTDKRKLESSELREGPKFKKMKQALAVRDNLKFYYGSDEFLKVSRGFYVDKTSYIQMLEKSGDSCFVLFRPRRFGKSLFLSTLSYYHDIIYINEFDSIFSECSIYSNKEIIHSKYLVLTWRFTDLNVSYSKAEFDNSLEDKIMNSINIFITKYNYLLSFNSSDIIKNNNAIGSLEALFQLVHHKEYSIYLLVDEYDTSVNEVITKNQGDLFEYLKNDSGPVSSFKRLFGCVKNYFNRGVDRVFITGVTPLALNNFTSGFNIAKDITMAPEFSSVCGFTLTELQPVFASLSNSDQEIINRMTEFCQKEFDGYRFGGNTEGLFNSTLCLNFLENYQNQKIFISYDKNVHPSDSVIKFVANHHLFSQVLSELLSSNQITVENTNNQEPIESQLMIEKLLNPDDMDKRTLVSFLFYTGALTVEKIEKQRTIFKIPNENTYSNFLVETSSLYHLQENNKNTLDAAVTQMFLGDIAPLVDFISKSMLNLLKHNDVRHSQESDLKSLFILAVVVSLGSKEKIVANSEHDIEGTQVDAYFTSTSGILPKIHLEFKNTTVGQIKGYYFVNDPNWTKANEKSNELATMTEENLNKLELVFPIKVGDKGNYLENKEVKTIGDMWLNTKAQAIQNGQKIKEPHISYAVYRIGLKRILFEKIEDVKKT